MGTHIKLHVTNLKQLTQTQLLHNRNAHLNVSKVRTFIKNVSPTPPGLNFCSFAWVKLNRIQTGIGIFRLETRKWFMASIAICECGAKEQTVKHVMLFCPICHHPNAAYAFTDVYKT